VYSNPADEPNKLTEAKIERFELDKTHMSLIFFTKD
jgi:hypothetical protein